MGEFASCGTNTEVVGRPVGQSTADGVVRAQQLAAALEGCRAALADHAAGLSSDAELLRTGLVYRNDEAWMLDLEHGTWLRDDGVTVSALDGPVLRTDIERWRMAIDGLRATTASTSEPRAS